MSKERMKHESLGSKLNKKQKSDLIKALRNELNVYCCLYYYYEVLKGGRDRIDRSYDKEYGVSNFGHDQLTAIMKRTKKDLKIKNDFSNTYDKILPLFKMTKKSDLSFRKFLASGVYKTFYNQLQGISFGDFDRVRQSILLLSSLYGSQITAKEKRKISSFRQGGDIPFDFSDMRSLIMELNEQCSIIESILNRTGKRLNTKIGRVVFNGVSYDYKKMSRFSKTFVPAYEKYIDFVNNTSEWLYLSQDLKDLPIIISDVSIHSAEGGSSHSAVMGYFLFFDKKRNNIVGQEIMYDTNIVMVSKFLLNSTVGALHKTMSHEFSHAWENHAERYDVKRYKRFHNAWVRYFIELKALGGDEPRKLVFAQQREEFLDGLSEYIKITKLKKSWKLEFKKRKLKPLYFPNKSSLTNSVVMMLTPSRYGLTDPFELLAETFAMLSAGQSSYIGVDINSDVPSFYVPAKKLLKLVKRYGFDK